ncbi:MAG: nicotinate phosphoribosyltransferase [Gammaproteobacteria bacterium]|nr:nicotinate phosphoribosyltransferase [Gammaproteobacteria bacterium]
MISPLLTDLYQLTMAYGYWKLNMHNQEAVFHLIFRSNPFRGNYALACGLDTIIDFLQDWHFSADDLAYLASVTSATGERLFPEDFLDYLGQLRFTCDVDAIPEGTVVFPHQPLIRIKGPLLQGQLIESTLLNVINFQTLIATKASRVYQAAHGEDILEFGLRRAQGPDGALLASRAAYIGGCKATSNVLAGKLYGIPLRGTHAHSWVVAFADEISAFTAYAEVMPHNCVLLVDTYDTVKGVAHAIEVGRKLRAAGGELLGIRLDSGDLAKLSIIAREMLDAAGFQQTQIVASNSLDEYVIEQLKEQGAKISIWGVGTNLVTAYDQPALDGVYKLSALRDLQGRWQYKIKLSEQTIKISNPGIYQVRRYFSGKALLRDVMYNADTGISDEPKVQSVDGSHEMPALTTYDTSVDLLQPIFIKGKLTYTREAIDVIRQRAIDEVTQFLKTHSKKLYPVGLEKSLYELKQRLIDDLSAVNHLES